MMDLGLAGKRVLVTAASAGIGRATALGFAAQGSAVTVVARRPDRLEALVDTMGGNASGHRVIAADLTEDGAATRVANACGDVDVVVHNLGGNLGVRDMFASAADYARVWWLNVGVAIELNRTLAPAMACQGWGRIVHVSTRASIDVRGAPAYSAAKAYLNAYTVSLGRDLASKGVVVSAVLPGAVATEENNWGRALVDNPDRVAAFLSDHQAIGRLGEPGDVVPMILYLASTQNRFAAGALVPIDGGAM